MVDFALLSGKLISAFVEDVAGYIEKKQEARCRQQCGKRLKSQLKLTVDSLTLFGGLMTVLGLKRTEKASVPDFPIPHKGSKNIRNAGQPASLTIAENNGIKEIVQQRPMFSKSRGRQCLHTAALVISRSILLYYPYWIVPSGLRYKSKLFSYWSIARKLIPMLEKPPS